MGNDNTLELKKEIAGIMSEENKQDVKEAMNKNARLASLKQDLATIIEEEKEGQANLSSKNLNIEKELANTMREEETIQRSSNNQQSNINIEVAIQKIMADLESPQFTEQEVNHGHRHR